MSSAIPDQYLVNENPLEHPAVLAWLELDAANRIPSAVTALYDEKRAARKKKEKKKSAVYKLEGAGIDEFAIVAKRCRIDSGRKERLIYEQILPKLPVSSPRYHGSVEIDKACWLFLDYAGGIECRFDNEVHFELAIQWLAEMHCSSAQLDSLSRLPDRGPRYYRSQLEKARQRIAKGRSNPHLQSSDIETLDRFVAQTELIDFRLPEMQEFCRSMPVSLVHNDFIGKNLHVRRTESGPVLLPFDWEVSGKGAPAVDLNRMFVKAPDRAIASYHEQTRHFDSNISLSDIEYMAALGVVFRISDAVAWASQDLLTEYPHKKISHFEKYTNRLANAGNILGWS